MADSTLFTDDKLGLQVVNLALIRGVITPDDWSAALSAQAAETAGGRPGRSLCEILLDQGRVTREQLRRLRAEAERKKTRRAGAPPGPALPPRPGASRLGKFELRREVGRGARGLVYEAFDTLTGRRVALKLLPTPPGIPPAEVALDEERFLRESDGALRMPDHPALVRLVEAGVVQGQRYLASDFVDGLGLDRWALLRTGLRERVEVLRDAARALHAAHEAGLVHGDLKPRNVLIDPDGRVHITDLGTARCARPDPRNAGALASAYLSPEQIRGAADLDRRADVYSLGAMLYEMLAGRPPFQGETAAETASHALMRPVLPPSRLPSNAGLAPVDAVLERLCLQAMSREREKRPSSAAEVAHALDTWLDGTLRLVRRARRRAGTGLAVAVAVGLGALALRLLDRGPASEGPARPTASCTFGEPAAGLRLLETDGLLPPTETFAGRACAVVPASGGGWGLLAMDVDEVWASSAACAEIQVEYHEPEGRGGYFGVQYDSMDRRVGQDGVYKWAGTVWLRGSGQWRTWRGILPNPRFGNRQQSGGDLRIFSGEPGLRIHRISLAALPAGEAAPLRPGRLAADPVDPAALRPGLRGEFFRGMAFESPAGSRTDPGVAFRWDGPGPFGLDDRFSARWSGWLRVPRTGRYLIEIESDNGARLTLGGRLLIDHWEAHASVTDLRMVEMEAGLHPFLLEFYEEAQTASIVFGCHELRDGKMVEISQGSFFHQPPADGPPQPAQPDRQDR
ncbi:MAG TPA: protein kinase [Planctomycetota bacterium]|nr:protein kinase [Planctomycetota bacterium]